jgi:hypothetical protein
MRSACLHADCRGSIFGHRRRRRNLNQWCACLSCCRGVGDRACGSPTPFVVHAIIRVLPRLVASCAVFVTAISAATAAALLRATGGPSVCGSVLLRPLSSGRATHYPVKRKALAMPELSMIAVCLDSRVIVSPAALGPLGDACFATLMSLNSSRLHFKRVAAPLVPSKEIC